MTDNYNAAQVHADSVYRIIDNGKTASHCPHCDRVGKLEYDADANEIECLACGFLETPTPNPAELGAGLMYATLAVADELRSLHLLIEDVMSKAGGRGFVRVFDEAPR